MTVIVTSGKKYLDIDAYGGIVAYAELLNLQGVRAIAASTAAFNQSITTTARSIHTDFYVEYSVTDEDRFIVIDVSEPDNLDAMVRLDSIAEVIDHHLGYEDFWKGRSVTTDIEFIGAACTQIYERWAKSGLLNKMSSSSAKLLSLGILDNTLNFKASVCTQRDIDAYKALVSRAGVSTNWAANYFTECQSSLEKDIADSIRNDTKMMQLPGYSIPVKVGQAVVWNGQGFIEQCKKLVEEKDHFINIVSIDEGRNYIIVKDQKLGDFIGSLLNATKVNQVITTEHLWLRKEIMKQAIERGDGI